MKFSHMWPEARAITGGDGPKECGQGTLPFIGFCVRGGAGDGVVVPELVAKEPMKPLARALRGGLLPGRRRQMSTSLLKKRLVLSAFPFLEVSGQ